MNSGPRDHFDSDAPFSPAGLERRERLLAELHGAMSRRRSRRRVAGVATVAASAMALMAMGLLLVPRATEGQRVPSDGSGSARGSMEVIAAPGDGSGTGSPVGRTRIVTVATRPGVALRLSASTRPSSVEWLTDAALLELAAEEGQPVGIQRTGGVTTLIAHQAGGSGLGMPDTPGADDPDATEEQSGTGDS